MVQPEEVHRGVGPYTLAAVFHAYRAITQRHQRAFQYENFHGYSSGRIRLKSSAVSTRWRKPENFIERLPRLPERFGGVAGPRQGQFIFAPRKRSKKWLEAGSVGNLVCRTIGFCSVCQYHRVANTNILPQHHFGVLTDWKDLSARAQ